LETQCWIWPPETDGGDGDSDTDGGGDGKTDGGGEGEADGGSGEGATARAEAIGETAIIHLECARSEVGLRKLTTIRLSVCGGEGADDDAQHEAWLSRSVRHHRGHLWTGVTTGVTGRRGRRREVVCGGCRPPLMRQ